jgi:hypothetical protein
MPSLSVGRVHDDQLYLKKQRSCDGRSLGYESESAFSTAFKRVGLFTTAIFAGGRMRLPLHIATGRPPTLIGSNLSQLDMRGWRLLKASSPYADGRKELDRQ